MYKRKECHFRKKSLGKPKDKHNKATEATKFSSLAFERFEDLEGWNTVSHDEFVQ
jgi:hypothetical protein